MNQMKAYLLYLLGIVFLLIAGLLGWFIGEQIPNISYLLICILIGLIVSNLIGLPPLIEKGIRGTHKIWLEAGIVILGVNILFDNLRLVGPVLLSLTIFFLLFNMVAVNYFARLFGLDPRFGSTLASGVAVCGVSAVVATGGALQIKAKDMAYAIAVVLFYDLITVFAWPMVGIIFNVPAVIFGSWVGLTMMSTGTTLAAGLSNSAEAGELATVIKMVRNSTIGIWALIYALYYANKGVVQEVSNKALYVWNKFPKFILGFIFLLILANIGFIADNEIKIMSNINKWLFMMAFVGLGYDLSFKELKQTGFKPLLVTIIVFIMVSILSFIILNLTI